MVVESISHKVEKSLKYKSYEQRTCLLQQLDQLQLLAPAPAPRHSARQLAKIEEDKLKYVCTTLTGICEVDEWDNDRAPIKAACSKAGIFGFKHLIGLSEDDILSLDYINSRREVVPLPVATTRTLIIAISLFHHASRMIQQEAPLAKITPQMLDHYRSATYNPKLGIIPWNQRITSADDDDLAHWEKLTKPSRSEYPKFKDEGYFLQWKENIETTLDASGLEHLIDSNHTVSNPALDLKQRKWLYKTFQDILIEPSAKQICIKYKPDKDTRAMWAELVEFYTDSMAATIGLQNISTYLTSTRLHESSWRGSQVSFLKALPRTSTKIQRDV